MSRRNGPSSDNAFTLSTFEPPSALRMSASTFAAWSVACSAAYTGSGTTRSVPGTPTPTNIAVAVAIAIHALIVSPPCGSPVHGRRTVSRRRLPF